MTLWYPFQTITSLILLIGFPTNTKLGRWEPECVKCSKTFCKMFARQNMQNQTNAKHSSNYEDIFKSTKNVLEKLKKDSKLKH